MNYFVVEIITQTSSFRNPDFQNFHKTLLLPPPTTVVGLAGAAMGLSPKKSQEFFEENKIHIGVYGKSQGKAMDLWKYRDFKGNRSVIKKEILFKNTFYIAFISDNEETILRLRESFLNPVYALTLGNNDSLAFVKNITPVYQLDIFEKSYVLEYCIISGNIVDEVIKNIQNGLEISIYDTYDPISYDLPIKFEYESDYGMRSVIKRKTFSFVSKPMKLNIEKEGILYKNKFIPINYFDEGL